MKTTLLSFAMAFSLCSNVNAATLYVNESGSGFSCSNIDPCPTIKQAVDNADAGDTIEVSAGTYIENVFVPPGKNGLVISGAGIDATVVRSAGGLLNRFAPATVPLDAVFQIVSADVTVEKLTIEHPAGIATKREIGVFIAPPANNVTIQKCKIIRNSTGEPTEPGSRGVFVIQAGGAYIYKNVLRGNYEDAIHVPGHDMQIIKNDIADAPRLGIVVIQETSSSNNNNNLISKNTISNSGSEGIQIQSDNNVIVKNTITGSGGAAIKLCGIDIVGDCINPFDGWANAEENSVNKNNYSGNGVDGVVDNGTANVIN